MFSSKCNCVDIIIGTKFLEPLFLGILKLLKLVFIHFTNEIGIRGSQNGVYSVGSEILPSGHEIVRLGYENASIFNFCYVYDNRLN